MNGFFRETEIMDLRTKLNQRRQSAMHSGTEERISSLTHSLVQKQAALESITAERNALRIQLEKLDVRIEMFQSLYLQLTFIPDPS